MCIPVYTVAAWSGTGKTTLLEKIIRELKARGIRLAVIKHDGHDFEMDREGKDSWRFTQAGADMTILTCATHAAILENRPVDVEQLIRQIHDVDMIITEGFKHGPWPKIALFREGAPVRLETPPEGFFAVVSDAPVDAGCPFFDWNDAAGIAELLCADMKRQKDEKECESRGTV